jgi:hypothetical protein
LALQERIAFAQVHPVDTDRSCKTPARRLLVHVAHHEGFTLRKLGAAPRGPRMMLKSDSKLRPIATPRNVIKFTFPVVLSPLNLVIERGAGIDNG